MYGHQQKLSARYQIPFLLARRFLHDYEDMLAHYTPIEQLELTDHLLMMFQQLSLYVQEEDERHYTVYHEKEDALLQKYGSRFSPYYDKRFYQYFSLDLLLAEADIYTAEQYNSLPEQSVTLAEIQGVISQCRNALHHHRTHLYLQDVGKEPQEKGSKDNTHEPIADEADKEATRSRQLLAIYYLFKASLGIEARDNGSVSSIARFIHLLTGTKFTYMQNSDIYKKYLRMPNYKKDSHLIEDLKFIRPYFEDLGIGNALELIDQELVRAIKELPYGLRQKYKNNSG